MAECLRALKPGGHALVWALPRTSHYTITAIEDAGFEIRDVVVHLQSQGFPKSVDLGDGIGTALKPSSEFWVLARKPLSEKTLVANLEKWGTGGLNIEISRVSATTNSGTSGRFPPNAIFSHSDDCKSECSEECSVKSLDQQSGILKSGAQGFKKATSQGYQGTAYGKESRPVGTPSIAYADEGGASRFFKCLEPDPFVYQAKAPKSEKNEGLADITNVHPTVKSINLMRYLINLITPVGGIVLDPFMGSGSTGVAAIKNGFKFIGIEMEQQYFDIAKQRIHSA